MSFLTAPSKRDVRLAESMEGLLELKEVVPDSGKFSFPPGWPPTESQLYLRKDRGMGDWVPLKDVPERERIPASKVMKESFTLNGMGRPVTQGNWLSPSQVNPRAILKARRLAAMREKFNLGGLGQSVKLPPREVLKARRLEAMREKFALGMGRPVTHGNWLSPVQVKKSELESGRQMISQPQLFGMGQPVRLPQAEFESPQALVRSNLLKAKRGHKNVLGGCGSNMSGLGTKGAQGAFLSPGQLPNEEVQSAKSLVDENVGMKQFAGLGQGINYVDPFAQGTSKYFTQGKITLPTFVTEEGKQVGQYAHPDPNVLKTAYLQRQAQLPAFYRHPTLGPWGVDPMQAYQYWYGQLQAMQRAATMSPMSVWQSPGVTAYTPPPLPVSSVAQPAAYNPYQGNFPVAGTAVEHF